MEKELLYKYFRNETSPQEEKQIMDWAESSPDNYRQYLEERKIWNALLIHYTHESSRKTIHDRRVYSFNGWKFAAIAASIAFLCMFSLTFLMNEKQTEKLQSVHVPTGQRVELSLEDGTKVWLNSGSTLTYSNLFGNKNREVELDGEGFFEVTKDKKKPFVVKTPKYDITVLGTTFNVYAYSRTTKFETSLLQGSLAVSSHEDLNNSIILRPNEMVIEINGQLQKHIIDNFDNFSWKDGLISLDDVPFEILMDKFASYFDIQVKIENNKVLDYSCTGKFRQSDGIEYALKVLQRDLNFIFVRDEENGTIVIK